jgi:deazaflavin-dependent oxidoreductase (nitroreductase family)
MSVPTFDDIAPDINQIIRAHIDLYLTDPLAAHMWDATPVGMPGLVPALLLTTVGRKSGKARHVPLLYVDDGEDYLIIGSKGGNVDHPFWYLNLQDNPDCEIRVAALHAPAKAALLDGEDYIAAWAKITARFAVYAKYQARAERRIPVVRLTVAGN